MAQNHPQSGHSASAAAARSISNHRPMNPGKDPSVLFHMLARMLPLRRYQAQVYRLAQKFPPGFEDGFAPIWEVASALLPARGTTQLRINFQSQFHLLAVGGFNTLGGFRAQLYDMKKSYLQWKRPSQWFDKLGHFYDRVASATWSKAGVRLMGRGVNFANLFGAGAGGGAVNNGSALLFLREPHPFTEPNAQCLVIIQNQDTTGTSNQIQVVLYGVARRFNWPD